MSEIQQLKNERTALFEDTYDNIIPKRVPINVNICIEAVAEAKGLNIRDVNWNPGSVEPAAHDICKQIYSDICPAGVFSVRFPAFYEISKSESFKMGSNGFMQHPEVVGMNAEDYDDLIENPWDFLLEKVLSQHYKRFETDNKIEMALYMTKTLIARNEDLFVSLGLLGKLSSIYGYYMENGRARAMTTAPFDFLADQLRSFSGISGDVRRIPEKVLAACDAIYPLMLKAGSPHMKTKHARHYSFLHMPTFMREKDFKKLWWPSFLKLCNELGSMGIQTETFCEDNWDRYLDYLYELPVNSILKFEYGDAQKITDKLGNKHIITGLYPITLLKTGTKQQCVDKAKELIDILAPGGKYIFSLDKQVITATSIKLDNLAAVTEYVRDNTNYTNVGETAGIPFNKEDYTVEPSKGFESKYYLTKKDYKNQNDKLTDFACSKLQHYDDTMFDFLVKLFF
ncbi:MAG: uroporphyrinogen decarboxylase [Eubacteriales bacterium]